MARGGHPQGKVTTRRCHGRTEHRHAGRTVAVAESLTSGKVAAALGRGSDAKTWFRGGVVAYQTETKQRVLGVRPGPIVTAQCAEDLATGVVRLLDADIALSTTGAGGPGPEEGEPAGTVYLGWTMNGATHSRRYAFQGSPEEVLEQTVLAALERLERLLRP